MHLFTNRLTYTVSLKPCAVALVEKASAAVEAVGAVGEKQQQSSSASSLSPTSSEEGFWVRGAGGRPRGQANGCLVVPTDLHIVAR
jgi:hypothetical protein